MDNQTSLTSSQPDKPQKQSMIYSVIDDETFHNTKQSKIDKQSYLDFNNNFDKNDDDRINKNSKLLLPKQKLYQISDIQCTDSIIESVYVVEKQSKIESKSKHQQKLNIQKKAQTLPSTPIKLKQQQNQHSKQQSSANYLPVSPPSLNSTKNPESSKKKQNTAQSTKTQPSLQPQQQQLQILPEPQPTMTPKLTYNQHLFNFSRQAFILYYKGSFIIDQILDPIQTDHLLDYKQQKHVEFIFLLCVRAENYLTKAIKIFQNSQNYLVLSKKGNIDISNVQAYLSKIKIKFAVYNDMLDRIRGKLGQKISKIFKLDRSVSGKQLYLDGYQGLDYTTEQQIEFTYCKYIEIVLNYKEIKNQYFVNHRFKKILRGYRKLCELTLDGCQSQYQWRNKVNEIIIDQ